MNRKNWLEQVVEDALEPELPIVDAHHHVWENEPVPPFEPYDASDLFADKRGSGHAVIGTIFVDSHTSYRKDGPPSVRVVGETEYAERVATLAMEDGRTRGACAAIVPHADLLLGAAVGEVLDAHMAASSRFRGIRHMTAYDRDSPFNMVPEEEVMRNASFLAGAGELAKRGLSLDAWVFHPQLMDVVEVARAYPDLKVILNHLGGPLAIGRFADAPKEAFSDWYGKMAVVAQQPNILLKVGGLNMGLAGIDAAGRSKPFTSREMADIQCDHVVAAIDLFGPARCMVESNAPVDTLNAGYDVIWNAFKRLTMRYTPEERRWLFSETAIECYRVDTSALAKAESFVQGATGPAHSAG